MATEFNPGGPIDKDNAAGRSINPPTRAPEGRNRGLMATAGVILALVLFGLMHSMRSTNDTASHAGPGITRGASPSDPPTVARPPGQGESNEAH